MKQILQNLKDGSTEPAELPVPRVGRGQLLIRTRTTLVSAGTERMLVDFGKGNWVQKARQQPDKVREVLDKVRTDGLAPTLEAVQSKLEQPLPLGYCNVGVVAEAGADAGAFAVGERVASNGAHAEMVAVPRNLCARVPDAVSDEAAAFAVIGAIALQGVRLAQPTLGEAFVVTGLGLVGLMAVQLLRANGCRVLGIDPDPAKTALARQFGAETVELAQGADPLAAAEAFSRGRGVDGVLLTLSASSSEPVSQAARMCRQRGRVILVGVTGLELNRADFYEKELSFQVSCSYGPGRYDPAYEDAGRDYPVGFVRWTEQRNFEAVLDLLASSALDVGPLITHRFAFDEAERAYALLAGGDEPYLGILLEYPTEPVEGQAARTVALRTDAPAAVAAGSARVGVIGAGNYAGRVLIPAFRAAGAQLQTLANTGGVSGVHYGRKHGFAEVTTDADALIEGSAVDSVVVATRHDSHADYACRALAAGKHVFVEKPLALTEDGLSRIETAWQQARTADGAGPLLMVGFNRRFAPQVAKIRSLLDSVQAPKAFVMQVNAGAIPADNWLQDRAVGGGRIVGEACHFIDLLRFLAGAPIVDYSATAMDSATGDTVTLQLRFADGSIGTVHYFANGSKAVPKERLEVFAAGRVLQLDNFRRLRGHGWPGFRGMRAARQDKGQRNCAAAFVQAVQQGGEAPIGFDELMEVSRVSVALQDRVG